ncbi:MAG: response regulator transcription factor [Chloroflexi bacterium]|nr:response regulator transcription factor [Chloroflexota bacterium]
MVVRTPKRFSPSRSTSISSWPVFARPRPRRKTKLQTPDGSPPAIRIAIADAQPLFRDGVRLTIEESLGLALVGEASTGREALQIIDATSPHVCLIDANLPIGGQALGFGDPNVPAGIELARLVKHRLPNVGVVILASFESEEQLFQAIKVGASAYSRRDITPEALVDLVRRVSQGEYLVTDSVLERPQVTARVLKQFRELSEAQGGIEPLFVPLSAREVEILDYIAHGQSNKAIARLLNISDQTVKNHITSILRKLAVNDRTQAVIYALRNNWIKL